MATIQQEITSLFIEVNNVTERKKALKGKKKANKDWLNFFYNRLEGLKGELSRRKENPERYPLAAGAGTIDDIIKSIAETEMAIEEIKNELEGMDQAIDDVDEERDQLLFVIADKLKEMRTAVGKEMAKHNRLQHEAYKAQKERYENCKRRFGFTPDDRAFIAHHKNNNQTHIDEWISLCDKRNMLCQIISALDPNDEDFGLDEVE